MAIEGTPSLLTENCAFLERIAQTIRAVEPDARIVLYGSRARGDARPDSDRDLLVLLDGPVDRRREESIWDRLFDFDLETGELVSVIVQDHAVWDSSLYRIMPLRVDIEWEGIEL